jgi:hypothetical protein
VIANVNYRDRNTRGGHLSRVLPSVCRLELFGGLIIVLKTVINALKLLPTNAASTRVPISRTATQDASHFYNAILSETQRRATILLRANKRLGLGKCNASVA